MRLNSFIAKSGFCSRRKAADYVKNGKVQVNGKMVLEPWLEIKSGDSVAVGGKAISCQDHSYIIINKPKGVTSTVEDSFAAKKVVDLVPKKYGRLYPVGRLDKESEGLMILTNDGELCYRITHPKFQIEKEYAVSVEGMIRGPDLEKIRKGVKDKEEHLKVRSAVIVSSNKDRTDLDVVICEGKKRHIRRLFKQLGFSVIDLTRVRIGSLELGKLRPGSFKAMERESIYKLVLGKIF